MLYAFAYLDGVKKSPQYGVKKSPPKRLLIKITRRKRNIKEKVNSLTDLFSGRISGIWITSNPRLLNLDLFYFSIDKSPDKAYCLIIKFNPSCIDIRGAVRVVTVEGNRTIEQGRQTKRLHAHRLDLLMGLFCGRFYFAEWRCKTWRECRKQIRQSKYSKVI